MHAGQADWAAAGAARADKSDRTNIQRTGAFMANPLYTTACRKCTAAIATLGYNSPNESDRYLTAWQMVVRASCARLVPKYNTQPELAGARKSQVFHPSAPTPNFSPRPQLAQRQHSAVKACTIGINGRSEPLLGTLFDWPLALQRLPPSLGGGVVWRPCQKNADIPSQIAAAIPTGAVLLPND